MIIWIASYPKSGNTWVRAFLSVYLHSNDGQFTFDVLGKIREFPDHNILKKFVDSKNFHNLNEVSKYWIKVQEIINLIKKNILLKTHNAFCNINGNLFTNSNNAIGFIYVVRDPRNVVLSMANHFGVTQEESCRAIFNEKYILYPKKNKEILPAALISSWKNHYLSWRNCSLTNKIIVRYEDLINNNKETFIKIINFLNKNAKIEFNEEKILNSINSTKFDVLKKQEDKYGFNMGQKNKFFYLGGKNNWKNLLDPKIEKKIRDALLKEMKELEYI